MRAVVCCVLIAACSARMAATPAPIDGAEAISPDAPAPTCTQLGCPAGQSCCNDTCIETTADVANCGACGVSCGSGAACCASACKPLGTLTDCGACGSACGSGDSCDQMQCVAPVYPSYCANPTVYVLYDGISSDINAASLLGTTFDACASTVVVQSANETDATLVDQTTGALLGGTGVTYVFGGGPFADLSVHWLEDTTSPIYFAEPTASTFAWMQRGNPTAVASMAASSCTAHFDQFVIERFADAAIGSMQIIGYGACGGGTFGAAYFYANMILANPGTYPDAWYVASWVDTTNDGIAGAGDTFTVLAHGN
jgi:stigma-specific protein Stig1